MGRGAEIVPDQLLVGEQQAGPTNADLAEQTMFRWVEFDASGAVATFRDAAAPAASGR